MKIGGQLAEILCLNEVSQIGIVVRDMERAMINYSAVFGINYPKVFSPEYFNMTYRGSPANFRIKIALGKIGNLEMELIEVLEGETIYGDFLENKGEGLHHLGFEVENVQERVRALEQIGIGVLQSGERTGVQFAYLDTEKIVGVIFEFYHREIRLQL